jgi:uncharacterized membrane protein YhiD involved in acid resistance
MVLQAIGDNVASGLGMLGALTVVQFRTNLRNPRDMIFIFAALGTGISCGLYGFHIAVLGVSLFCISAFVLRFTPFHFGNHAEWVLFIRSYDARPDVTLMTKIINDYCKAHSLQSVESERDTEKKFVYIYEFAIVLKDESLQQNLIEGIEAMGVRTVRINKKIEE